MNSATDREADIRTRIRQHWEASERGDIEAEHAIYADDAILDYPQSGDDSGAGQGSRRNVGDTRPSATSP